MFFRGGKHDVDIEYMYTKKKKKHECMRKVNRGEISLRDRENIFFFILKLCSMESSPFSLSTQIIFLFPFPLSLLVILDT